jgi:hypothetical protein
MKNLLLLCMGLFYINTQQAQVLLPSVAPAQTIKQEFGLGSIEVNYTRPGAKGRRVFGDLVAYGKLWGTSSVSPAKLSFTEPVEIFGKRIDSGKYVLYTIPGEESWEILLNKGFANKSTAEYKESQDVFRFKVTPLHTKKKQELLTFQFEAIRPSSCELQILWEKKLIIIPIDINLTEKIRAQIEAAMLTDKKPYWEAAQFFYEYDRNLSKALENAHKATNANPTAYWMHLYKARIQQEMGYMKEAMESSLLSLELARQAKNTDYVDMNKQLQKELKKK